MNDLPTTHDAPLLEGLAEAESLDELLLSEQKFRILDMYPQAPDARS